MASFFDVIDQDPVPLGEPYPWPNRFSLETSAYCNRSCSFCPQHDRTMRPKQQLMSESLFCSIVEQLNERGFDGVVQLFLLNEPTLDKRLFSLESSGWARHLRTWCPDATLYVSTNADVLNRPMMTPEAKLLALGDLFASGVNVVNLNVYDVGEAGVLQAAQLRELAQSGVDRGLWEWTLNKYRRHSPKRRYVCVSDMRTDRVDARVFDLFHSKGHAPSAPQVHCARPHRHMVVRWDGKVPLCCAIDPTAQDAVIVGDLSHSTITEVWDSDAMFKYRWFLQQKRRVLPGCSTCDHRMSYSHVVRRVSADQTTLERWEQECREKSTSQVT